MTSTNFQRTDPIRNGRVAVAALCLVLCGMLALFFWNYSEFFGPDSIYYFARMVRTIPELLQAFCSIDNRGQYRPMGMVLFTYLLFPVFHYNVVGHHIAPLCFHACNILLVYMISRRLLAHRWASIAAAGFFGLHRVDFFVTYGISFIPDFTGVFFFLTAFLFYLKREEGRSWLALSFFSWIVALFSKEVAVVFPAIVAAYELLWASRGTVPERIAFSLRRTAVFWAGALGFIVLIVALRGGSLYPSSAQHPYAAAISAETMAAKIKYLWWAMNLPQGTGIGRTVADIAGIRYVGDPILQTNPYLTTVAGLLLLPFAAALALFIVREVWRFNASAIFGATYFFLALGPALPLSGRVMQHNLYFPLPGMALLFGIFVAEMLKSRYRLALPALWLVFVFSTATGVYNNRRFSWPVIASRTSAEFLKTFHSVTASHLDCNTAIVIARTGEAETPWYTDGGNLFRVFGPCRHLKVYFEDLNQQPDSASVLRIELRPRAD